MPDYPDPRTYLWLKTVLGDKSDNVPKVPGIGEKKIPHIVANTDKKFWKTIFDGDNVKSTDPIIEKLIEHRVLLALNWKLVNLRDFMDIHLPDTSEIESMISEEIGVQERQVQKIFFSLGFKEILGRVNSFMRTFKLLSESRKEVI
jgi:5'-3' exonuclease